MRVGVDAEVDLAALADDVEGRAQLDLHRLLARRVVDQVLADEFQAAVGGVELRDADLSRRQRHAEAVGGGVLQAQVDVDLLVGLHAQVAVGRRRAVVGVRVGAALPVVDERLLAAHARRGREELDLLGRVVGDRSRATQGIEVILEERFLDEALGLGGIARSQCRGFRHRVAARLGALHVARDQFQLRVGERGPRLVHDRDPCRDVDLARAWLGLRVGEVVVGPPRHAAGLVGEARLVVGCGGGIDVPDERGLADEAAGKARQSHLRVVGEDAYAAVGLAQREAACRGAEEGSGDRVHPLLASLVDRDLALEIARQQLRLAGEVELEVLLDHTRAFRVGKRGERDRRRVDESRDVVHTQEVAPGLEREQALLAHQRVPRNDRAFAAALVRLRIDRPGLRARVDGECGLRHCGAR